MSDLSPSDFGESTSIPLSGVYPFFPLPDLIFFPGVLQPLRIFEPRYLQMIEDMLDSNGRLVLGTLLGDARTQASEAPAAERVGGLGELHDYRRLDNGQYLILVHGKARVEIEETESDRMYRKVVASPIVDVPEFADEGQVRAEIKDAIESRAEDEIEIPEEMSTSQLNDMLMMHLRLSPPELYKLYSVRDLEERVRGTLAEHATREP